MKSSLLTMVNKITPQVNLRPAGVWDFMSHPGHGAASEGRIKEFERLWLLAEREAFAAGESLSANAN